MHYEIIDMREEIAAFEKEHRFWPRSGSVSKPYGSDGLDPWNWFMWRWSEEDRQRAVQEFEQEQFYKYHRWGLVSDPGDGEMRIRSIAR